VQAVPARCASVVVPEDRARPGGRRIRLRVVIVPSARRPAAPDAFTFLTGGPGGAATELTSFARERFAELHRTRDILLVDQRGTGGSNRLECRPPTGVNGKAAARAYVRSCLRSIHGDMRLYGTGAAADDLEAVRVALGYRRLDVYGASYGATAAQVYLQRHPRSVRAIVLDGGTGIDVPFYGRFAENAQRALDDVARRCAADRYCTTSFPGWRARFSKLARAWDEVPAHNRPGETTTGTGLQGIVQNMLLDAGQAAAIPLVVTRAAARDYEPLNRFIPAPEPQTLVMHWSILCNEPWVGLGATGPWHTDFDAYATASIAEARGVCSLLPRRTEPTAAWTPRRSAVPLLALAGGADPQDPITNLPRLRQRYPNSRAIVVPHYGHTVVQYGCLGDLVSQFVTAGSARRLDTRCVRDLLTPGFTYS
jgi:pimeloyl-ACP methyl ester carboxylesterase